MYCRSFYQSMRDRQNILGKGFVESLCSCDRKWKGWKPRIPYFTALAPPFVSLISLLWGTKMWQKDVSEETRLSCWCNEKHRDTYAGDGVTLSCPNWDILQMTGYAALTCFWQEGNMKSSVSWSSVDTFLRFGLLVYCVFLSTTLLIHSTYVSMCTS